MPRFVILWKWTDQGIRNVKDSPKRRREVKDAVEKAGGRWVSSFYTLGAYDGVVAVELPSDEAAHRILLSIGSGGNVRTTTLKAFTEAEADKVIGELA
ncbi:MAG: GYD domain-containing protein [Candidatus Geothermarchaeales archaeon]